VSSVAINGERYVLSIPKDEVALEGDVLEHVADIFGDDAIAFGKKHLSSASGVISIPDGYVVRFGKRPRWYVLEVELASHSLYDHVVPQLTKFISGIKNPGMIRQLTDFVDQQIEHDPALEAKVRQKLGGQERYKFIHSLLSTLPTIVVVIDTKTDELDEVSQVFAAPTRTLEFRTYTPKSASTKKAFVFETFEERESTPAPSTAQMTKQLGNRLELEVSSISWAKFNLVQIPLKFRAFFPGYRIPFTLETDVGEIQTYMSSAPQGTTEGDPAQGKYFQANLKKWYLAHPEAKPGVTVVIEALEPMKRYRLSIK
jgi:hypothetical protein